MTIGDALARLFPTLLGTHPMSPVPGYQPDISFVFQLTNVAKQLRNLGLRSYLVSHIPDLIGPLQSTARATNTPCQCSRFVITPPPTTPRSTTRLVRLNQMASTYRANDSYSQSAPLIAPVIISTKPDDLTWQIEQEGTDGPMYAVMYSGIHPCPMQVGIYDNWGSTTVARVFLGGHCQRFKTRVEGVVAIQQGAPHWRPPLAITSPRPPVSA